MAKRLSFTWAINEQVENVEEITEERINKQVENLNHMLAELKSKIEGNLYNVQIDKTYIIDCNRGYKDRNNNIHSYNINNRMNIIISKKGRKSTWNDVYKLINGIKPAKYDFI